jgi:CRP-like cAMP-binding protein
VSETGASDRELRFADGTAFACLSYDCRALLERIARPRSLRTNELIYLQADPASGLYIVRSGYVRLSNIMDDGSVVLTRLVAPGEVFGELPAFDGGPHQDTATAQGPVSLAVLPSGGFARAMAAEPEIAGCLGVHVARRTREFVDVMCTQFLGTLAARLAQVLLRLLDCVGEDWVDGEATSIAPFISQTDLGCMARGTRENVNIILKDWERKGLLRIEKRRIRKVDRAGLIAIVHDG